MNTAYSSITQLPYNNKIAVKGNKCREAQAGEGKCRIQQFFAVQDSLGWGWAVIGKGGGMLFLGKEIWGKDTAWAIIITFGYYYCLW